MKLNITISIQSPLNYEVNKTGIEWETNQSRRVARRSDRLQAPRPPPPERLAQAAQRARRRPSPGSGASSRPHNGHTEAPVSLQPFSTKEERNIIITFNL